MVRKKLAMAVFALSALQADLASALGLGNVSVRSALNQPLNAEIRLLETGDLDASQIKVALAPAADFERAGVDRDYFLGNLRFSVELDGRGGGVVRVTTREPVVEPYLNFILETRWPSGRLLREYAVLLDLPTFTEGARVPFVPAGSSGLSTVQQQTRSAVPAPAPASNWSMPGAGPGEYRVQQNDTMGKIAARLRPSGDISIEQAMLAIQRANPHAFIRNNVNLVKAGYVLRIPSADEFRAVSPTQASQEVAAQTRAWRSGETYTPGSVAGADASAPQLDARTPATATPDEGGFSEQGRLSIATPGDSARAASGEGAATSGAGTDALRGELAAAQEGLDSARRENAELQSRLDDLERQVATLNRLITLKDEQLAALQARGQQQLAAAGTSAEADAATGPAEAPADAEAAAEVAEPLAEEADAFGEAASGEAAVDEAAPAAEPVVAKAAPAAPAQPPKPAPAPQPGLLEQLTANPLIPAAGAGVVALILAGLMLARRRKAAAEAQTAMADLSFDFEPAPAAEPTESVADLDTALISDEKVADAEAFAQPVAEAPVQRVRPETGDAIAEADIYIAYGRYQQAVELLKGAIDAEPQRTDLRIKLLEVYLEMRDRDAFRRQFTELQALGDEGAVAQVKEMLSSVDGVAGWLDDLPGSSSSAAAPVAAVAAVTAAAAFASAPDEPSDRGGEFAGELELDLDDSLLLHGEGEVAAEEVPANQTLTDDQTLTGEMLGLSDSDLSQESGESSSVDVDLAFEASQSSSSSPAIGSEAVGELELDLSDDSFDLTSDDFDLALDELSEGDAELQDLALDFAAEREAASPVAGDEFDLAAIDEVKGSSEEALSDLGNLGDLDAASGELAPLADLGGLDDLELELEEAPAADSGFEPVADAVASAVESPLADLPATETFDSESFTADAVAAKAAAEAPVLTGGDDEFDFLTDADEVATKLDLARAYIDMGDTDGARDILSEVMQEGTEAQRQDASALLSRIG
jgi:pilus assembly protein FimV